MSGSTNIPITEFDAAVSNVNLQNSFEFGITLGPLQGNRTTFKVKAIVFI